METYVQLILILALVKYCLKAALTARFWTIALYGAIAAAIGLVICPIVIEQPVTIVTMLLSDREWVANGAVITTLEAVAGIFISIFLLDNYFMRKENRKRLMFVLKVIPGLLSMIGIAYFELMFFRWRVGADFTQTALLYGVIVFSLVVVVATALRYLLKGESLKLELKVVLNIGILIIGLLVNSSIADYNLSYAEVEVEVEWGALTALAGLVVVLFFAGIYLPKINTKSLYKNSLKWNK